MPIHIFQYISVSIGPEPLLGDGFGVFCTYIAGVCAEMVCIARNNSAIAYAFENRRSSTGVIC